MAASIVVPLISTLISAGFQAFGAAKSAQENKKNQYLANNRQAELDKELYQGVLDDPGSQAYLRTLDRNLRDSIQGIENSAVSTGATQENVLAQKRAANEVTSDAIGNLLQREDAKRDNLLNRQANLDAQQMAVNNQKAQNWANVASTISNAATSLGSAYMLANDQLFKMDDIKPIKNMAPTTNVAKVQNVKDPIMQSAKSGDWRLN